MKKTIRIIAAVMSAASMLAIGSVTASAGRSYDLDGWLYINYHYIPILKDTAEARTCTSYGLPTGSTTGGTLDDLWATSTATAYDKSGNYVTDSHTAWGTPALEGLHESGVTVSIRNMRSAYGTHKGGTLGYGSATKYSSWNR